MMKLEKNGDVVLSWEEVANLTHAKQVELFNFCLCEDNEGKDNPYPDCPTENGEICLICNENKDNNGLIVCSKCNEKEGE